LGSIADRLRPKRLQIGEEAKVRTIGAKKGTDLEDDFFYVLIDLDLCGDCARARTFEDIDLMVQPDDSG